MSLNVQYAIQIAQKAIDEKIDIEWWEEVCFAGGSLVLRWLTTCRRSFTLTTLMDTSFSKRPFLRSSGPLESTNVRIETLSWRVVRLTGSLHRHALRLQEADRESIGRHHPA